MNKDNLKNQKIIEDISFWLENAVIGLGLCPFAKPVWQAQKIRFVVSSSHNEESLLLDLADECLYLEQHESVETTLLIIPDCLQNFDDFNQFLDMSDALLGQFDRGDQFQIASFHPQYQFSGTNPDDRENWTNRSPYPVLHLLREDSLTAAVENHPSTELIPTVNIEKLNSLDECEFQRIFRVKNK